MTPLRCALERLRDANPHKLEMQEYVDEVRRVAKWALDALDAAEGLADRLAKKTAGEE
jgi:hypothetical protein